MTGVSLTELETLELCGEEGRKLVAQIYEGRVFEAKGMASAESPGRVCLEGGEEVNVA